MTIENVDRTVAQLVASHDVPRWEPARADVKQRLTDVEARLRRFQAAIASGVDPAALVKAINAAQAERAAARAELDGTPAPGVLTEAEVYAMVDALGDVGAALAEARPGSLTQLSRRFSWSCDTTQRRRRSTSSRRRVWLASVSEGVSEFTT